MTPSSALKKLAHVIWLYAFLASCAGIGSAQTRTIQPSASQAGGLDNAGASARAYGMGSAFVGIGDDTSAVFFNPAGLSGLATSQLVLHHNSYLAGTFEETLVYGFPLDQRDGMALALNYVNWGNLDLRDANGVNQGSYNDSDVSVLAGWGREWAGGFSAGVALRGLQQKIVDNLYNEISLSFGALWKPLPRLRLGAAYSNLGTDMGGSALAQDLQAGGSYLMPVDRNKDLLLALSGDWQPQGISRLMCGLEGDVDQAFLFRAGYQLPLDGRIAGGSTAYSIGAGLRWREFSLDYAYLPFGDFGASHRLSLGYQFPQTPKEVAVVPVTVYQKVMVQVPVPTVAPQEPSGSAVQVKFKVPVEAGEEGTALLSPSQEEAETQQYLGLIKTDPQNPDYWWKLGNLYFQQKQKDSAVQCFEQVLRLRPENQNLKDWLERYKAAKP
jgi:tetratricopeptide (TPR) repeat protein